MFYILVLQPFVNIDQLQSYSNTFNTENPRYKHASFSGHSFCSLQEYADNGGRIQYLLYFFPKYSSMVVFLRLRCTWSRKSCWHCIKALTQTCSREPKR